MVEERRVADHEQARHAGRHEQLQQSERHAFAVPQRRGDQEEAFEPHAGEDEGGDRGQARRPGLDGAAQQHHEGDRERHREDGRRHRRPGAVHPVVDELGLLREVAVPDHQVLRPEQVGPEDAEAEQQLAEVVQLVAPGVAGDAQPPAPRGHDRGQERQADQQVPDEVVAAEQGREPVRVERHDEVEGGQREHPAVGHEHRHGPAALPALADRALRVDAAPAGDEPRGESGGGPFSRFVQHADVRPQRAVDVAQAETAEQQERQRLAQHEERRVQPRGLRLDRLVDPRRPGGRPRQQDEQQDEGRRQEGGRRLGDALERTPPAGRRHLQDAGQHHARLRQTAEEEEVDQQRLPGAGPVQQEAGQEREAAQRREAQQQAPGAGREKRAGRRRGRCAVHRRPARGSGSAASSVPRKWTSAQRSSTLSASPKRGMLRPPSRMIE